jgi:hypothetical protein
MKKPSKSKEFKCKDCILSYTTNKGLMRHILNEHDIPIKCDKCNVEFTDTTIFKKHLKKVHPKLFSCTICNIKKLSRTRLVYHMEAEHQDNCVCPQCGVMCKTKIFLKKHIKRMHSTQVLEKCNKCDYKTNLAFEMKSHFKIRHTDTKETCQYCGEVFKRLKKHLKRTGCGGEVATTIFSCARCKKEFKFKPDLDIHVKRVHHNVKDKQCQQCSYATYSGFNLRLHVSKVHIGKNIEKKACPYCVKVTTNLNYHINIMHNEHFVAHTIKESAL